MPEIRVRQNSLILYKQRPGIVNQVDKKLEITVEGSQAVKVRPKDVLLLHPGPLFDLADLVEPEGEVETAWELLAGGKTNLSELAELAYGEYTPASAWATWQLVVDGLYFSGSPDEIVVHPADIVARERESREVKAAEQRAWADFMARVQEGTYLAEDARYLAEVEALALAQQGQSRLLRELGHAENPPNAHALLLDLGYWNFKANPYPLRERVATQPPAVSLPGLPQESRRDLTHLLALAIDDEGSRDPDDALSLEDDRLWVHIADVAALVPPDSPADLEARGRGANLYLPEGTVPMLPAEATQQLGLGLDDVSPALSFGMSLDPQGEISGLEIVPSWVRVTRLSYEEAETRLGESPLAELHELAHSFERRRQRNGAIQIELPEVKVQADEGQVTIRPLAPLRSRDLVREAMLMAGEAVARFALEHQIPIPFTVQEAPEPDIQLIPDGMAADGPATMFARRRMMKRSQQQSMPAPHAGLGMELYAQSTSPLRRYLDLVTHQQLRAYLRGDPLLDIQAVMERVGAADAVTGSVRRAERLSIAHWTHVYLLQNHDWCGQGVVVDKRGARVLVLIPSLALETEIYPRQELSLDSAVTLSLVGVDLANQQASFRIS